MQRRHEANDSEAGPSAPSESTQCRDASTASQGHRSAPFRLQGTLPRRVAPVGELLVMDTPPSYRANPSLQTASPPLLGKGKVSALSSPTARLPVSQTSSTASCYALPQPLALRDFRESCGDSTHYTGVANNAYTPLTNASAPSLPYTWTDSYLEESPETMRARWIDQQTFGPVLQSEGGGDSTIASTCHTPKHNAEAVWGRVQARNALERDGKDEEWTAAKAEGQQQVRHGADGGGRRIRRVNIEAAERGGEGLGGATLQRQPHCHAEETKTDASHDTPRVIPGAPPASKTRFPASTNSKPGDGGEGRTSTPKHLLSDVSTVIATVQQSRHVVPTTSIEKKTQRSVDPFSASLAQGGSTYSHGNNVYMSTSSMMLTPSLPPNAPELRASREVVRTPSPAGAVRDTTATRRRSSTGPSPSFSISDYSLSGAGDRVKTGGGRASRNGPMRLRVLKPIYDD
ncbi:hypothetical protein ABB37_05841 [Leptomonas pyrrhocoris]|uniref:Uncharacterized protein n=1 Tax=Leptomonas pyrrhocoris TaxID=157538 RepID=A0A0M9FYT8_LEPPY|nr:hypothetical protein ABB37_05841 [Leptomonas pyrrhocoris]XP_015657149.1 hypothetical protein ABB37_05841 [Leptomonas pyrrhocoris]KPA78709.1 hypothetical protein ABB37_05841 [Leptomonas pyrrhocoris]KPA78710.1 hypothetical protein ABB37_05841 [Leptomonas pyrrhocoris]|eukprot:XP_015657148.1 hypothetical protein ABB37_05841 [Leptomonas pyrrhocoris]